VGGFSGPPGSIYTSADSGNTWTSNNMPNEEWSCVASSADGSTLAAVAFDGVIYTSTNSGNIWISNNVPNQRWSSVAMSADGSKLAAVAFVPIYPYNGAIYTSADSGNTWISNNVPNQRWSSAASSADGSKLVATVFSGGIYTLYSTPAPQLNITPSDTNVLLSWLVPSINFVMQQSSDLGSWTDMTNTPVLNLTNLQNEVILSPASDNVFYRLKTP
jgi:hypothetical protein